MACHGASYEEVLPIKLTLYFRHWDSVHTFLLLLR